MNCRPRWQLGLLFASLGALGCSGTVSVGEPSIAITSPMQLQTVEPGTDAQMSVPIEFTVMNFTLKDKCNGATNCGHVVVMVDLNGCVTFGEKYNNIGSVSPVEAHFSRCPMGSHSLHLELHHDDDTAELDQNNNPVQSSTIVISLGIPDGGP